MASLKESSETGYFNSDCMFKTLTPYTERLNGEVKTVTLTDEEWEKYRNIKPSKEPVSIPYEYRNKIKTKMVAKDVRR